MEPAEHPERWRRAESLFEQALARPSAERARFLDRACGPDTDLRRNLEVLIDADSSAGAFLARPLLDDGSRSPNDAGEVPGELGRYRLIRQLGEGGTSKVWLAVRADGEVRQRVAIKVLRRGMATADQQRRLRRERQILASLDHPNIARLLDAGSTRDGLPYVVMEYIEGEPITAYCDRHRLGVDERLRLFRHVCAAVHYAHQNLIVHRDLKPSNILVGEAGVPKLLDFGIAKLLNPELTTRTLIATLPWQQHLTPEYASPEQILGRAITTASDVYSLGVLLFELLCGRRPFALDSRSRHEIERVLQEEEPVRPSVVITTSAAERSAGGPGTAAERVARMRSTGAQSLARRLAGDLDNIVAKALLKEPQHRYGSTEQLSEDLRRHLEGRPVRARPATWAYRFGRFLRRNRAAVAAVTAFVTLVVISALGLGQLSLRLTEERDEAAQARDRAQRLGRILQDIFDLANPEQALGPSITARELLDRAVVRVSQELAAQPELLASTKNALGEIYVKLSLYDDAAPLLEDALRIRRQRFGPYHPEVAESLASLGTLEHATGRLEAADGHLRGALAIHRGLGDDRGLAMAEVLRSLAALAAERGAYEESENLAREALAVHRQILDDRHPEIAEDTHLLGVVLWEQGRAEEAERSFREALGRRRALFGDDHPSTAESMNGLAAVLISQGSFDQAERLLLHCLGVFRQHLSEAHPDILSVLNTLASLATYRNDWAQAASRYQEALALASGSLGDQHPDLVYLLIGLGSVRTKLGRAEQGEEPLRRALAISSAVHPDNPYRAAMPKLYLGFCLMSQERYGEAERFLIEAYDTIATLEPPRETETHALRGHLVRLYREWGREAEAERYQSLLDATPVPQVRRRMLADERRASEAGAESTPRERPRGRP